jgi:hypothetical protein
MYGTVVQYSTLPLRQRTILTSEWAVCCVVLPCESVQSCEIFPSKCSEGSFSLSSILMRYLAQIVNEPFPCIFMPHSDLESFLHAGLMCRLLLFSRKMLHPSLEFLPFITCIF